MRGFLPAEKNLNYLNGYCVLVFIEGLRLSDQWVIVKKTYSCLLWALSSTAWASVHKTLQSACFSSRLWTLTWLGQCHRCTRGVLMESLRNWTAQRPTFSALVLQNSLVNALHIRKSPCLNKANCEQSFPSWPWSETRTWTFLPNPKHRHPHGWLVANLFWLLKAYCEKIFTNNFWRLVLALSVHFSVSAFRAGYPDSHSVLLFLTSFSKRWVNHQFEKILLKFIFRLLSLFSVQLYVRCQPLLLFERKHSMKPGHYPSSFNIDSEGLRVQFCLSNGVRMSFFTCGCFLICISANKLLWYSQSQYSTIASLWAPKENQSVDRAGCWGNWKQLQLCIQLHHHQAYSIFGAKLAEFRIQYLAPVFPHRSIHFCQTFRNYGGVFPWFHHTDYWRRSLL